MKFVGEPGSLVKPVTVVARKPEGTGLAEHSLSLFRTLNSSIPLEWIDIDDFFSAHLIEKRIKSGRIVIFSELPSGRPRLLSMLSKLKNAHLVRTSCFYVWDSDVLPPEDVELLKKFGQVVSPSEFLTDKLRSLGVSASRLDLALDIRSFELLKQELLQRKPNTNTSIRLLSLGAFHPRKNHDTVIKAVVDLLEQGTDIEFKIHSNLAFGSHAQALFDLVPLRWRKKISITTHHLSQRELLNLFRWSTAFVSVSGGEAYNVGARYAITAGIPTLISDIAGHEDLRRFSNVVFVPATIPVPAVYPERNGAIFGVQYLPETSTLVEALKVAATMDVTSVDGDVEVKPWDHRTLDKAYKNALLRVRTNNPINLRVVAHDGGFFSLFNTIVSLRMNWEGIAGIGKVEPDWSVAKLKDFWRKEKYSSFCYGRPEDGEVFLSLFPNREKPTLDAPDGKGTWVDIHSFDSFANPDLTYIHAGNLYRSSTFQNWRERMHEASKGIYPSDAVLRRVAATFSKVEEDSVFIGMHVRHPSHAMEQPDKTIALAEDYISLAMEMIKEIENQKPTKVFIFLATDQERVVGKFRKHFGERLLVISDVHRTSDAQDSRFDALESTSQLLEGHQVQHLMSSNEDHWSKELAQEVIADAWCLAKCHYLLHSVSNVATAVSYLNPTIQMTLVEPGLSLSEVRLRKSALRRTSIL